MKIDKRNPVHWLYLLAFVVNVAIAALLRPLWRARRRPLVLLYGHKLNGNLLSLYEYVVAHEDAPCDVRFLTMDPRYYSELRARGVAAELALAPHAIVALAEVACVVSDHGLHAMSLLPRISNIRFADVWHGVPFKGWDASDFRALHAYDEVWVSSRLMRGFYLERFGFRAQQVHVTGYGRTDRLVRGSDDGAALREALGIAAGARVIAYAPTWQHGSSEHSVFPFGCTAGVFMDMLRAVCVKQHAVVLFRTHLNTRMPAIDADGPFRLVPSEHFPDTEAILLASDILVCDWSSIAFDYLVLDRPTIFLDVPAPFPKGFTLGPEYRFGAIAPDLSTLAAQLEQFLATPELYRQHYGARAAEVRRAAYDDNADGRAAQRYCARLAALL